MNFRILKKIGEEPGFFSEPRSNLNSLVALDCASGSLSKKVTLICHCEAETEKETDCEGVKGIKRPKPSVVAVVYMKGKSGHPERFDCPGKSC